MTGRGDRLIFHIDVNPTFLSWECVYRPSQGPEVLDLRTVTAAVGGNAKSRHGIVLAKSPLARRYGVTTGELLIQAMRKCSDLVVVPFRFGFYIKCSWHMMELLEEYTPDYEKFSTDEIFLDMTSTTHLLGSPLEVANEIRERIRKDLGFTVDIGISTNRLLAEMASDFEKPDKCHTLLPREVADKMWPLPIRELFFVEGAAQRKMENLGLHTIGQLICCNLEVLKSHLGEKYAVLIRRYANGIDDDPVAEKEPVNKAYGNSITLSRDISDYESACQVLPSLCETVGVRLRAGHVLCNNVCAELRDWEFKNQSHQMVIPESTDSTSVIYKYSCRLLRELWHTMPLRLMGVWVGKISDDGFSQISLFDDLGLQKKKDFEKAVDAIRSKYGVDSVKRASFLRRGAIVDHVASKKKHLDQQIIRAVDGVLYRKQSRETNMRRRELCYTTRDREDGIVLGQFLKAKGFSHGLAARIKAGRGLTVDGMPAHAGYRLKAGETVEVALPEEEDSGNIVPVKFPLSIVYEDEDTLVINKDAGMSIHSSQGHYDNTLANVVSWCLREEEEASTYRIISRLDRGTTGLLILARYMLSTCILSEQMAGRRIRREYRAIVLGHTPEGGTVDSPIARAEGSTIERWVDPGAGERAVTHYRTLLYNEKKDLSLVSLSLGTGRAHQIRVHMRPIGHPLPGDFLYCSDCRYTGRQPLHSCLLRFERPISGREMELTAGLPEDMERLLPPGT